jgi:AcrR family transcriptional regulator
LFWFKKQKMENRELEKLERTPRRILEAAEMLFAENGYDGTSMRDITRKAEVSLALVNYHFGNKENLLREIVRWRMQPINSERLQRLKELEAHYGDNPIPLEKIVDALLEPFLRFEGGSAEGPSPFIRCVNLRIKDRPDFWSGIWKTHFNEITQKSMQALRRTLPDLDCATLAWRVHFMVGLMLSVVSSPGRLSLISDGRCDPLDMNRTLQELTRFTVAGLQAAVPPDEKPRAGLFSGDVAVGYGFQNDSRKSVDSIS